MSTEVVAATNGKKNGHVVPKKKVAVKKATKRTTMALVKPETFTITVTQVEYQQAFNLSHQHASVQWRHRGSEIVGKIDLEAIPGRLAKAFQKVTKNAATKATLERFFRKTPEELLNTIVTTPAKLGATLNQLTIGTEPFFEYQLNGTWYPIPIHISISSFWGMSFCRISANMKAEDETIDPSWYITGRHFLNEAGYAQPRQLIDLLKEIGLRPTTPENIVKLRADLLKSEKMSEVPGRVVDVTKPVLVPTRIGWRMELMPVSLASEGGSAILIIENLLERSQQPDYGDGERIYPLPMVRAFSPDLKKYVYVDVNDITPHEFDQKAKDLIVLPDRMKQILDSVFTTKANQVFGDLFRNRHGGVIIMAAGSPGVGKTLTAEVYSEYTKRPLYVMEMGELGTNLETVEANLQNIFDRARRWNAVLLFDEADVFLNERGEDLDKSAIVGVFLRLLDRYEGCLFLTTNRPEVIDKAVKSRVTLTLKYPPLEEGKRRKVWTQLCNAAGIHFSDAVLTELMREELNGRNIRNAVRVLRMLHPDVKDLSLEQAKEALEYIAR